MLHVPYKGGGPALVDLLAGNVQLLYSTYATSKPHIESGRVRPLGVSTLRRLTGVPIPTIAEQGLPGYDAGVWYAVLAPAGTPRDIVSKLNSEIVRALNAPEVKALLEKADIETIGSTPEGLTKFMADSGHPVHRNRADLYVGWMHSGQCVRHGTFVPFYDRGVPVSKNRPNDIRASSRLWRRGVERTLDAPVRSR